MRNNPDKLIVSNFLKRGGKAMIANRSVRTNTVLPHPVYRNVADAIAWLTETFGFTEYYRYGESGGLVNGAQMYLGDAWIMLQQEREHQASPARVGYGTQSLTIFVEDVEAHFQRAKAADAKIVEELHETGYGEVQWRGGSGRASLAFFAARTRRESRGVGSDVGEAAMKSLGAC
jgi:uncharacterized glyoxalase superfamily protein PhnB